MVIPRALLADEREVKFLVQRRNGDVEAEDLVREAVGIGNGVGGGLEQLGPFLFRVFLDAGEEVEDAGARKADVDSHLAVFDGERALAVAGLIDMEHGAVGVEVGSIDAVGQGRFGGRLFFGGRIRILRSLVGFGFGGLFGLHGLFQLCRFGLCGLGRAGGQQREQHQRSERKGDGLFHDGSS